MMPEQSNDLDRLSFMIHTIKKALDAIFNTNASVPQIIEFFDYLSQSGFWLVDLQFLKQQLIDHAKDNIKSGESINPN